MEDINDEAFSWMDPQTLATMRAQAPLSGADWGDKNYRYINDGDVGLTLTRPNPTFGNAMNVGQNAYFQFGDNLARVQELQRLHGGEIVRAAPKYQALDPSNGLNESGSLQSSYYWSPKSQSTAADNYLVHKYAPEYNQHGFMDSLGELAGFVVPLALSWAVGTGIGTMFPGGEIAAGGGDMGGLAGSGGLGEGIGDLGGLGDLGSAGGIGSAGGMGLGEQFIGGIEKAVPKALGNSIVNKVQGKDPFSSSFSTLLSGGLGGLGGSLGSGLSDLGVPDEMVKPLTSGALSTVSGLASGRGVGDSLAGGALGGLSSGASGMLTDAGVDPAISGLLSSLGKGALGSMMSGSGSGSGPSLQTQTQLSNPSASQQDVPLTTTALHQEPAQRQYYTPQDFNINQSFMRNGNSFVGSGDNNFVLPNGSGNGKLTGYALWKQQNS